MVLNPPQTCQQKEDVLRDQKEEDQITVLRANSYLTCTQDNSTQPNIHCNST